MVERNQRFRETCCLGFRVFYPEDNKPDRGKKFFASLKRSGRLWHPPPTRLFHRYREVFPGGKSGRGVKLTTHLHLLPRLRMSGVIYPLPICLFGVHTDNYPTDGGRRFLKTLTHIYQPTTQCDIPKQLYSA